MKDILFIIIALAAVVPSAWAFAQALKTPDYGDPIACNVGEGTHEDSISLLSDEAVATKHLLMTAAAASDTDHFAICAADEEPIGFCPDEVATAEIGEARAIHLLSKGSTRLGIAAETVTKGEWAYTAAGGKLQDEPTTAGTYWQVGRFLTAGTANNMVEVETMAPRKLVVIAALTSTDGTAAAAADLAALKAEAEKIGDDVRAIAAALASPALVKVL